jgi:mannose-6-phosphate isomerase-like protein (cupin superfamily)
MDNTSYIEEIKDNKETLAIIIRSKFSTKGIKFFTPNDFSQQLAYLHHEKGKKITPHVHNIIRREVHYTQEVLFIKTGRLKVDIYRVDRSYLSTHILEAGDFILLVGGGHGFEVLEDIEMIEVKQGPYAGEQDKVRFEGIKSEGVNVKGKK